MPGREPLELEIKKLIVESLVLEDVAPEEIDTDAALFVDGLGLDSIDALELAMVLEQIGEDPDENRALFASVASLAEFVETNRTK